MWMLKLRDPCGQIRKFPLEDSQSIGSDPGSDIPLRDATAPAEAARVWRNDDDSFWFRSIGQTPIKIATLTVREGHLPPHLPAQIGETRLQLVKREAKTRLPECPRGLAPWESASETGFRTLWNTKKAAATRLSLHFNGETGTGKEVLAHLAHGWSERSAGPFVPLHCGALPLSLVESELFGHVKGAFTGAEKPRRGALAMAHNGTLFLDEVGDLPLEAQVKLLRFLENGEVRPVGSDVCFHSNVRVISATHKSLEALVREKKFRKDLYYRITSIQISIPTLRSRPKDVELLARKFTGFLDRELTDDAIRFLQSHFWPGNVRQLRHAIERAVGLSGPFSRVLTSEDFQFLSETPPLEDEEELSGFRSLRLRELERQACIQALRATRGNRSEAAKILGVARSTLFDILKRQRLTQ